MISDPDAIDQKIRGALACCSLAAWPTPLETAPALAPIAGVDMLWLKREDRAGGSKVRGLEFLFADAPPGSVFVTIGGTGSSHCLATAVHASRVGGRAVVAQFPQPPSDTAAAIAAACRARAAAVVESRSLAGMPLALFRAWRVAGRLGPRRWIPGGGAAPAGVIGQFLGGLELAAQLPAPPDAVVAPLGSSGTVAGLALALAALAWPTRVVGVRVASRIVASGWHAASLALRARRKLAPIVALPRPRVPLVVNGLGRGYGHPTAAGEAARRDAGRVGLVLDSTYSAKAFAALPEIAALGFRRVVFWHTFAVPSAVEPS
jgi:D-cysteine desulfhydrase